VPRLALPGFMSRASSPSELQDMIKAGRIQPGTGDNSGLLVWLQMKKWRSRTTTAKGAEASEQHEQDERAVPVGCTIVPRKKARRHHPVSPFSATLKTMTKTGPSPKAPASRHFQSPTSIAAPAHGSTSAPGGRCGSWTRLRPLWLISASDNCRPAVGAKSPVIPSRKATPFSMDEAARYGTVR